MVQSAIIFLIFLSISASTLPPNGLVYCGSGKAIYPIL